MNKNNEALDEDEDEIEEVMTSEEHLESVLFQFVTLYERWSKDRKKERQVAAQQNAEIDESIKIFAQNVSQFAELEEKVRGDIHTSMHNEAKNTAIYLGGTIADAARREVIPTVKKLETAMDATSNHLQRYQSELRSKDLKMIGLTAVTTLLTSLLIVFFLMPKPVMPITDQQIEYLKFGESLRYVWPKLSKTEQEHIKKLAVEMPDVR